MPTHNERNVLGGPLETCSLRPLTGFMRDGNCRLPGADAGRHGVCAEVTAEFLEFTRRQGNDLSSPQPHLGFAGLKPGDRWCLCVDRWQEAASEGVAPPVLLAATHADVCKHVPLSRLERCALLDPDAH